VADAVGEQRLAIVVGGTGLYLHALLHGLAPVPEVPAGIRKAARARLAELGAPAFHAELSGLDPVMAARLQPTDRQRLLRAYEVVSATGRSLAAWQEMPPVRVSLPARRLGLALVPPRAALYERIERRLRDMLERGALEELGALHRRSLPADLPLMKALAVPELLAHVAGRGDLDTAGAGAAAAQGGRGGRAAGASGGPAAARRGDRARGAADPPVRPAPDHLAAPPAAGAAACGGLRRGRRSEAGYGIGRPLLTEPSLAH